MKHNLQEMVIDFPVECNCKYSLLVDLGATSLNSAFYSGKNFTFLKQYNVQTTMDLLPADYILVLL